MPALSTRMSIRPCCCTVAATSASTCDRSPTSQATKVAPSSPASDGPRLASRSAITTFAPSRAKRRAQASPMPCAPPVPMTTRPLWPKEMVLLLPVKARFSEKRWQERLQAAAATPWHSIPVHGMTRDARTVAPAPRQRPGSAPAAGRRRAGGAQAAGRRRAGSAQTRAAAPPPGRARPAISSSPDPVSRGTAIDPDPITTDKAAPWT